MTQRGQRTSYQQRIEIGECATAGVTDRENAKAAGCSIWTVGKWRRRYKQQGQGGWVSQLGRPAKGALARYAQAVSEQIEQVRRQHPGLPAVPTR